LRPCGEPRSWAAWRLAAVGLCGPAFAQKTKLTVYTAIENEQLDPFKKAFEADNPTIEIAWVRDSTGVMTAKLIAEKDKSARRRDLGLAASSVGLMGSMGMIEPYTPAGAAALKPMFKSKQESGDLGRHGCLPGRRLLQYRRGGEEQEAQTHELGRPHQARLQGLDRDAEPGLVGHRLSYESPAGSPSWARMPAGSSWTRCTRTCPSTFIPVRRPVYRPPRATRLIGIGFDMRGATEKTKGAPIDLIVPKEGLGWEMEVTAIMKGTKNLEAAKKLADWASTKKANELYGKYYAIVANPEVKAMPPNYPADGEKLMAKMDVEWMAKNPRSHPRRMDQALRTASRRLRPSDTRSVSSPRSESLSAA